MSYSAYDEGTICGACTCSGGGVISGPGYNTGNRIAEDLVIEKWWLKAEIVTRAEEKGLLQEGLRR
jgi:hypothetical protein